MAISWSLICGGDHTGFPQIGGCWCSLNQCSCLLGAVRNHRIVGLGNIGDNVRGIEPGALVLCRDISRQFVACGVCMCSMVHDLMGSIRHVISGYFVAHFISWVGTADVLYVIEDMCSTHVCNSRSLVHMCQR